MDIRGDVSRRILIELTKCTYLDAGAVGLDYIRAGLELGTAKLIEGSQNIQGNSLQFTMQYIGLIVRLGFFAHRRSFNALHVLYTGTVHGLMLDTTKLLPVIQLFHAFFYNMGFCGGTFATVSLRALDREVRALDYIMAPSTARAGLLRAQTGSIGEYVVFGGEAPQHAYIVDFILLLSGEFGLGKLQRARTLPTTVLTMSDDIRCLMYADIALPLRSDNIQLQYFFLEFCIYSYMLGARSKNIHSISLVRNFILDGLLTEL